jgi:hypothetical protein
MKLLSILPVCKPCIVIVLVGDGTVIDLLRAAITDIRCFIKSFTVFFLKVLASLIAGRTGSASDTTQDDLATGIGFLTMIAVDTEVFGVIKSTFVVPVGETMDSYFL